MNFNSLGRIKALWLLMFLLVSIGALNASHMMGTDMSYRCLGGGKYKIVAKVYRDCRGVAFNSPSFGVFAGKNRGNGCGTSTLSISRVSITDVSQLCSSASPTCDSNKAGTGNGVEMHLYEAIVDFNSAPLNAFVGNSSCCEVTFYLGQCCRNGAITTGSANDDFFATTTINICNAWSDCNSSPVFSNQPIFYACCNQPYRFNHGLLDDTPGDSISFRLISGLRALPGTPITYAAPFSYRYPVTPYCSSASITCTPKPAVNPPMGFYFDGVSGDMVFTPTKCDEVAIVAVEAIEYKKVGGLMVEMGSVRRDMQLIVENCANNMVPEIQGSDSLCISEGDSICFEVAVSDTLRSGQTVGDSVELTWNFGIAGATFTPISMGKNPISTFCWRVPMGASRRMPYTFSVKAMDNNCSRRAISYKGFVIKVGECSALRIKSTPTKSAATIFPNPVRGGEVITVEGSLQDGKWELSTANGVEVCSGNLLNQQFIVPPNIPAGMYTIRLVSVNEISDKEINSAFTNTSGYFEAIYRLIISE
ncbi:MAG: hypothetical protein RLZZ252_1872 [Bacteroidota bacterium]|jgi:hypothetical protein